jgi:hypothetical protein
LDKNLRLDGDLCHNHAQLEIALGHFSFLTRMPFMVSKGIERRSEEEVKSYFVLVELVMYFAWRIPSRAAAT